MRKSFYLHPECEYVYSQPEQVFLEGSYVYGERGEAGYYRTDDDLVGGDY